MTKPKYQAVFTDWFRQRGWQPFPYQQEAWQAYAEGYHGLLNAPTGSGKTYAVLLGILMQHLQQLDEGDNGKGLRCLWITPIRALGKEILQSTQRVVDELELPWTVETRTGDTSSAVRQRQKKNPPNMLITTPESLHLLLAQKGYAKFFKNLTAVVCDEWHELMGSKRGVQIELGLSRLKTICPNLRVWGISATIGNMDESIQVLLGNTLEQSKVKVVKSDVKKRTQVTTILPDEIEKFPWAGHIGTRLLHKVLPLIRDSKSTLIFTNTRGQAEIWYQKILDVAPELAGLIAMHHGSISRELRSWVEDALYDERLKAVVCTSSLDLGVDFRPVETIIQVGSPKGVARFIQRAGRSNHRPGETSNIYFLPTHSLELVEAAALRHAADIQLIEEREPYIRSFDVLLQYLMTLAVSDGFYPEEILEEVRTTFSYESISDDEWRWVLNFLRTGGETLEAYDEYKKIEVSDDGLYKVNSRRIAMRHRLSIGTIVSDATMAIKFMSGGRIGHIEEYFISKLKPGDVFFFAGRTLEIYKIREMDVLVKRSKKKSGKTPSWMGGRMPLSAKMSEVLRYKLQEAATGTSNDIELTTIQPLIKEQERLSHVPSEEELLIELLHTREGYHVFLFPFEGRNVHEALASLLAWRISRFQPMSFSIAYNDYGLELLSDTPIPLQDALDTNILSPEHLYDDILASINATEMAGRQFRNIANIAGLVFRGYPGKYKKERHLQSSTELLFRVFNDYDRHNLLLRQAYEELMTFQMQENRLRAALNRIHHQRLVITEPVKPTPFAFPLLVDRLRERLTSEKLEDRIKKMKLEFDKAES